jgi:hypothetical protein
MSVTVHQLFTRITGTERTLTRDNVKKFVTEAGVSSSFLFDSAGAAADAVMEKLDPKKTGKVSWDQFRGEALSLLPPGLLRTLDAKHVGQEVEVQWARLDPHGLGEVKPSKVTALLTKELAAQKVSFAGMKAEVGAKILMHALDENGDKKLQKSELAGFVTDVLHEANVGPKSRP